MQLQFLFVLRRLDPLPDVPRLPSAVLGLRVSLFAAYAATPQAFEPTQSDVRQAILDGEIVCLDKGMPRRYDLMYHRRGCVCFSAFDLLWLARQLRQLLREGSEVFYVHHFDGRGIGLYQEVCRRDLEGNVAKFKPPRYGLENSWIKIKNPRYSQMAGRHLLFATRSA